MVAYYMLWNRDAVSLADLRDYAEQAAASIEFYGGRFASLCGTLESPDGLDFERRVVAIEFPTIVIAREWHGSSRYEAARELASMLQGFDAMFLDSDRSVEG
ncbi:YciI-related domain-containing protein (plasmid) [Rhizobium phaseoli]|uniref:DUF1330 domain-containing protein n=1 Tax=Rhizobium phaseoli TaxID=396 RepID=UPI0007E9E237|nr:DUF1330 domain-containing protein [Rhizobium phaseoli]ANL51086.1 YciI-related domain-containing protein [Rhizobium phaseoli]